MSDVNKQLLDAAKKVSEKLEGKSFVGNDLRDDLRVAIAAAEQIAPVSREGYKHYLISEPDLLHLMSVKIGAAYTCVKDASKRTGIPVTEVSNNSATQQAEQAQQTCQYCDGTGDVHSITGEWRGVCSCEAGQAQQAEPVGYVAPDELPALKNGVCAFLYP